MEARWYHIDKQGRAQCKLCPRNCTIPQGEWGSCKVRQNIGSELIAQNYGFPCSINVDPVEKKPLYHFRPHSEVFSVATSGCNLFCKWCQNASISHPEIILKPYGYVSPMRVVELCRESGCSSIAFTYTEPTIFFEYMIDIAKLAKSRGLATMMISNGYIEKEPLLELCQYLDAANIDLKAFEENAYVIGTSSKLAPVLETITTLKEHGVHLEITTLIVPGVNDDDKQLEQMYAWIRQTLGEEQVVHISRFYPMHKEQEKKPTPHSTLKQAAQIAKQHLHHVYIGNVPFSADTHNTFCPACKDQLIDRELKTTKTTCSCGYHLPVPDTKQT